MKITGTTTSVLDAIIIWCEEDSIDMFDIYIMVC
jgi:hypothetical protein